MLHDELIQTSWISCIGDTENAALLKTEFLWTCYTTKIVALCPLDMTLVCSNLKKNYFFVAKGLRDPIVVIVKFSKKNCLCKQMNETSYEVRMKNGDENEIGPDSFMREKLEISEFIIQVNFFSVQIWLNYISVF